MKVKVIKPFFDITDNLTRREPGTELDVGTDRGAYLIYKGLAEQVKERAKTAKAKSKIKENAY